MKKEITPEASFLRKLTDETQEMSGLAYIMRLGFFCFIIICVLTGGYFVTKS